MSSTETTLKQEKSAVPNQDVQKLEQLLSLAEEIRSIRKKQTKITLIGVLVILVILGLFAFNLIEFARGFDQAALVSNTCSLAGELLRDPEVAAVQQDVKQVFYPELKKQLSKKFQNRMPLLQEAVQKESDAMITFVENDLQKKVLKCVVKSFDGMEKRLVSKYGKSAADADALERAFKDLDARLTIKLTDTMEEKIGRAADSLVSLNKTIEKFKTSPEYKTMQSYTATEVENRLIESLLELWIYNLNPIRGEANYISSNGGI